MSGRKAFTVCSRALRGVFAGRTVRFGNNVSEGGGNWCARCDGQRSRSSDGRRDSTRRMWKPNAHKKRLFSETLGTMVQLNVTTHALRCIDKAGGACGRGPSLSSLWLTPAGICSRPGLDNYLLNTRIDKLGEGQGPALLSRIQAAQRQLAAIALHRPAAPVGSAAVSAPGSAAPPGSEALR